MVRTRDLLYDTIGPEAEWRFRKQRSRKAAVRTESIGPTYFVPFRTFRSGRVSPITAIPTKSLVGFVLIQATRPIYGSPRHRTLVERGTVRGPRAANRLDQEAATVDHQSLAAHEGLSHQVEIALGNVLRVGDMPHR